jgi:hypothetical protein
VEESTSQIHSPWCRPETEEERVVPSESPLQFDLEASGEEQTLGQAL